MEGSIDRLVQLVIERGITVRIETPDVMRISLGDAPDADAPTDDRPTGQIGGIGGT